jgi:hypothetical protein
MAIFIAKGIAGAGEYVPTAGVLLGAAYNCTAGGVSLFSDVSPTDSFCKHIHYLWAKGIVSGCSATLYCPTAPVARDATAKFLANAFNLQLSGP